MYVHVYIYTRVHVYMDVHVYAHICTIILLFFLLLKVLISSHTTDITIKNLAQSKSLLAINELL